MSERTATESLFQREVDPEHVALTFGECEGLCGGSVTFPGWDRYCQRERRDYEEDEYLYGI